MATQADVEKQVRMVLGPLAALLRSRKVMVALVSLLVAVLVGLVPELEPVQAELILVITVVAAALIGGTAAEDVARLRSEATVKAAQPTDTRVREAVNAVLDELLAERFKALPANADGEKAAG